MAGLRFTIPGESCTMVPVDFKSLHPFLKVARRCFIFLDECCTLHRRCCTLWISILRTAITVASFRVTGAITRQNEGLSEFYGFDSCKPSTDSFIPKKGYLNLNLVYEVFCLRFSVTWIFTLKREHRGWSSIYHPWRVVHHGTGRFKIPAPISKSRTALFRLFRRMLHLAPQMLHPVDIDSSDGHNCCLV